MTYQKLWVVCLSSVVLVTAGCRSCNTPPSPQQNILAGSAMLLVSEPYYEILSKEATLFCELYPNAKLNVRATTTEEAIVHFLNDSVQIICIDRALNQEESNFLQQSSISTSSTLIAFDGLAIVVHELNPLQFITLKSLESIVKGKVTKWQQIPESHWSGSILFAITHKHSGTYELVRTIFFHTQTELPIASILHTQTEVLRYISKHPQAIGFVPYSVLRNNLLPETKVIPVEIVHPDSGTVYRSPTQENLYTNLYPFRYSLYLYTRESSNNLGLGFGTFLLTYAGQKLIQDAGIAPVKIPSRPIQLTVE
ncbi:MAG: substrate-binding domain-containing protein [Bacteroidetes bacterium]|nr:substrate-binding domain-containing protein [Bacteroidota bacterium]